MEDALLVGGMLITMLNHCDRVKIACLAQTVNAIAPIMTRKGGGAWRQAIYWPFYYTSMYAKGGLALRPAFEGGSSSGTALTDGGMAHPFLVTAAVLSSGKDELRLFVVNRNLREAVDLEVCVAGMGLESVVEFVELKHTKLNAVNTEEEQGNVHPTNRDAKDATVSDGALKAKLAAGSWNLLRLRLKSAVVSVN